MGNDKDKLNLDGVFPLDKADQMQPKAPRRPKDPMASHLPKFPFGEAGKSASPKGPVKGKGPVKVTGPLKGHGPLKSNGPVKVAGPANGNGPVKVPTSTHPEANAKGYVPSQGDGTTLASDPLKGTVNPQNGTTQMNDPAQTTPPATQNGGTTTAQLDPSKSASISERVDRPRHSPRSHHSPQEGNSPRPHHARGRRHHPRPNPAADAPSEGGENRTGRGNRHNAPAAAGTGAAGTVVIANGGRHGRTHGGSVQADDAIQEPTNELNQDQGNESGQNKPDELTNKPEEASGQNPATELPQDQENGAGQETPTPPATAQDQAEGPNNNNDGDSGGGTVTNDGNDGGTSGGNNGGGNNGDGNNGGGNNGGGNNGGGNNGGGNNGGGNNGGGNNGGGNNGGGNNGGGNNGGGNNGDGGNGGDNEKIIDTEAAERLSDLIKTSKEKMLAQYTASIETIKSLSSTWQGAAGSNAITKYTTFADSQSQSVNSRLNEFSQFLSQFVSEEYRNTENTVSSKAELI